MRYLLAYDAECGACSAFKSIVGFLDPRGRLEFVSLDAADARGLLESVDRRLRYSSFHLVSDGATFSGSEAILPLVRAILPGGPAVASALGLVPGVQGLLAFLYGSLSRLHGVGSCAARR